MSCHKEYKVWNSLHKVQKEVIAESLEDLLKKVKDEFEMESTEVKLVLDEDGTEVDDEEYFQYISSGTTFQILLPFQTWTPIHLSRTSYDACDGPAENVSNKLLLLLSGINSDLAKCLALSDNHLEEIIKMPVSVLAAILLDSHQFARNFKEACELELIGREDNDDVLQLLRMISQQQNESAKRRKTDDTDSDD